MGLDMYLTVSKYVSGSEYSFEKDRDYYNGLVDVGGARAFVKEKYANNPCATVDIQVGYWRKANQVHGYFVHACQDGIDNCRRVFVPREALIELRDICKQLIDSKFDEGLCEEWSFHYQSSW